MFTGEFVFDLQRFKTNYNSYTLVSGTESDDTIDSYYKYSDNSLLEVTINAKGGNDSIYNARSREVIIYGGDGRDTIVNNNVSNVTIDGGAGNDSINVYELGSYFSIDGGDGNDTIAFQTAARNCTLSGGSGNDCVSIRGVSPENNIFFYNEGDGDDTIFGYDSTSTLSIAGSSYSTAESGRDVIVYVGDGSILLREAAYNSTQLNIKLTESSSSSNSKLITLTEGDDTYNNSVEGATINALGGNDTIQNGYYDYDHFQSGGSQVNINAGAGNDYIFNANGGDYSSIDGGAGNDVIDNWAYMATVSGGTGNDTIYGDFVTFYSYKSGDGNDLIQDFNANSTLQISGGTYSSQKNGDNVIITVGNGKITLQGAASLENINISGTKSSTSSNTWKLNGTTATYGDKIKITGVKSLDGISLSGKVVTIANSALNKSKVTISDGYNLKLASDVAKTSNKKAWSLSGTTAKYNQTTKAGYKLANNVITYTKKATKTLVTVIGVKSTSGLSISGKIVTIAASSLNKSKVTISDGYNLKLASDVAKTSNKKSWSLSGTTAKYNQTTKAGYKLSNNVITYTKKATKTLATINGAKSKSGISISGKTIKLAASALSKKVSVSGGYAFEFASDYKSAKITGSSSADTIKTSGANMTITGGKGNDSLTGGKGADIFVYSNGDGNDIITNFDENDKISLKSGAAEISTSGNDVIFNVGSGKITLKKANGKNITYFDASGNENIYPETKSDIEYNSDGTGATLTAKYSKSSFEPSGTYKDILVTIDAAAVTNELTITGNQKANRIVGSAEDDTIKGGAGKDTILGSDGNDKIYGEKGNDSLLGGAGEDSLWGGAGSDTLWGGDGDDTFIYKNGDGKVTIADFEAGDMIMILSDKVDDYDVGKNDVTINIHGGGQIVVKNGSNKYIQPISGDGIELKRHNPK